MANSRKLLLIGTNHADQMYGYEPSEYVKFGQYISDLVKSEKSDLLAEEMSRLALHKWGVDKSVLEIVAGQFRICHLFCDPTPEERDELGIPRDDSDTMDPKREGYWLNKLIKQNFSKGIFVLGEKHIDSFVHLVDMSDIEVYRVIDAWRP